MTAFLIVIILVILLLLCLLPFLVAWLVQRQTFRPIQIHKYSSLKHYSDYQDQYERQEIHFPSGKNQLFGAIYPPKAGLDQARGLIVFAHGIWSGPEEYLMLLLWLVDRGYAVFTYNATSYNGSEGSWARGLYQSPLDLDAALTYVEKDPTLSGLPRYLMGHSWGGFAVTAGLHFNHRVDGVISLSGFDQPIKMTMAVAHQMFGKLAWTFYLPLLFINRCLFGRNVELTAVKGINQTQAPVLLVHGKGDDFIGFDTTSIISQKDRITNPALSTIVLDRPDYCGHNSYFLSKESETYSEEINQKFSEEEKKWKKEHRSGTKKEKEKELADLRKSYYEKTDKNKTNVPNEELYQKLYAFLEDCEKKEAVTKESKPGSK